MNVFEAVKGNVTTRQTAEMYGIRVNRHGMAVCPFHNEKNPSMKVNWLFAGEFQRLQLEELKKSLQEWITYPL